MADDFGPAGGTAIGPRGSDPLTPILEALAALSDADRQRLARRLLAGERVLPDGDRC